MDFRCQTSSAPSGFFVVSPFLTPLACWWTLIVVLSSISVVSSTKSCSIRAVRIFSHIPGFCPCPKPAVYALPWPEPFRQIPPWYSRVQPIQDPVEHYPVAFSWPASLRLLFWRKLIPYPIPLLFAYFMSFHVLHFTIKVKISGSNVLTDRAYISEQGASYVIPPQSNISDPWPVDWWLYKERHLVECFFQKLKWFRRTATRYDKLDASFLACVYSAAIAILLI